MPPDTLKYMIFGYAVILSVMLVYVVSLWYRIRRMNLEKQWLEEAEADAEKRHHPA
jgi:hypothetical protein